MRINVTKTFLPSQAEYQRLTACIFDNGILTNNGPFVRALESSLKNYLDVEHLSYVNNGTMALLMAIRALDLSKKVITTPFSYVATCSTLLWEGIEPVMADIDPNTLTIDPVRVEEAITPEVTGILATHVYGNACAVEALEEIANRHDLVVIYDAAHAFGTKYKGKSLFSYGHAAAASFHATKIFHTIEGGAVISENADVVAKVSQLKNFGHKGYNEFELPGINGKASEFHAAMGLCVLPHIEKIMERRKIISRHYDSLLSDCKLRRPGLTTGCEYNYAYYPIIFPSEQSLLDTVAALNAACVYPRRYFYPSLSQLPFIKNASTPIAESISPRVLCLPLYFDLPESAVEMICEIILKTLV